jgi:competence protein ComEC
MKLPSLFPVVCFAGGILLALGLPNSALLIPRIAIALIILFLLFGYVALRRNWILAATAFAAGAWLALGVTAANLERAAVPANLASTLIESGQLDVGTALRWQGRLRSDPLAFPWGLRYEIDLEQVQTAEGVTPVAGGLRLTYYTPGSPTAPTPPAARAGDAVETLVRVRPVNNFGDPGAFDFRGYLTRRNIQLQGSLRSGQLLTIVGHPAMRMSDRLARVRGRFLGALDDLFAARPDEGALARAMLLGDRSFVERDRTADYQKTGVYHVLVLAGLHVGALAAFFLWAARHLRLRPFPRILLTLMALAAYAGIVEDRPPIVRAVLMAGIFLSAKLIYRRMDLLNVAALSALVILFARPSEITEASFLLSFSAMAVIGGVAVPCIERSSEPYRLALDHLSDVTRDLSHAPRVAQFRLELRAAADWLSARLPRRVKPYTPGALAQPLRAAFYLWEIIFLSAVLQFGMLPPLAYYFHRVALAGPLANPPALLLTGLAVPIGFLTLGATLISHTLAQWLATILASLLAILDVTVRWFAHWHGASFRVPGPSVGLQAVFVGLAIALSAAISIRCKTWLVSAAAIALLAAGAVIAVHPFAPHLTPGRLEVTVLDVGQGDSLFLSFPRGRTMLVDAGSELGVFHAGGMRSGIDVGEDVVSPYLWSRGLKKIDVVALTHAHEDHLGGLPAIFENFRVGEFWVGRDIQTAEYRNVLAAARAHGVVIRQLKQGDTFSVDGVAGSVLWPEDLSERSSAKNDDSLVLRLTDGAQSYLLAGDIERPSERSILAEGEPVDVDFLRVAHHGSKTSTTDAFVSAAHPAFAAISVGRDNSFGHPSPEVTERLEAAGVHLYRTDRDGAITASTDGATLGVSTFLRTGSETAAPDYSALKQ